MLHALEDATPLLPEDQHERFAFDVLPNAPHRYLEPVRERDLATYAILRVTAIATLRDD